MRLCCIPGTSAHSSWTPSNRSSLQRWRELAQVWVIFLPLWDVEVGKNIYFDRPRVNQRRHSQLCAKKFAQTLHPARKETWRSDFNKEFGIVHFEHQTIENTALPATWPRLAPLPVRVREEYHSSPLHPFTIHYGIGSCTFAKIIEPGLWIRIRIRIRIGSVFNWKLNTDPDPDPGGQNWPTKVANNV